MKRLVIAAAALVLIGVGCAKAEPSPQPPRPAPQQNAYPGTEPYVAPTAPPPGASN